MSSGKALELPGHIYFGPGMREKLFQLISRHHYKRVLFVTGSRWFEASGWQKKFEKQLSRCITTFLPCRPGEPEIEAVGQILEKIRQFKPEIIVGIGGGSVIDTAKACSALATQTAPVLDYLEGIGKGLQILQPGLPLVAMPTTAGTGTEATKNAVLKSIAHMVKKSMRSAFLLPAYVIVDPELALELSPIMTGMAGMDALVQLFEAYVSKKAQPAPQSLIKPAFPLLLEALYKLGEDGHNLEARTDAAYGALISGIALANSGLGAVHGFASSLGGATEMPHGLICALFFQPVLDANAPVISEGLQDLFNPTRTIPLDKLLPQFTEKLNYLIGLFGLADELQKYSLSRQMIPIIARNAEGSSMSGNPRVLSQMEKESIINRALKPILTD